MVTVAVAGTLTLIAGCGTAGDAAPDVRQAGVVGSPTALSTPSDPPQAPPPPPTVQAPEPQPVAEPAPTTRKPAPTTRKPTPRPVKPPVKPVAAKSTSAPCGPEADVCVDLSANKAWLMSGGRVTYGPVPITSGKKGFRTPPGTFRVQWKAKMHLSRSFNNAPMPFSVFFHNGMAFHEGSLRAQSHGCIHLSRTAAKRFFGALAPGDVVRIVR